MFPSANASSSKARFEEIGILIVYGVLVLRCSLTCNRASKIILTHQNWQGFKERVFYSVYKIVKIVNKIDRARKGLRVYGLIIPN